ncbi:MAG TPA: hypothetical protein V6D47_04780 [Oscillatoriaceae cyanobacterium]
MTIREWEGLFGILTEASPHSIFLELAFLESFVAYHEKRATGVPLEMFEAALPFFEEECHWKPRLIAGTLTHPAWWRAAAAMGIFGLLASSALR